MTTPPPVLSPIQVPNTSATWDDAQTKVFIELYKNNKDSVGNRGIKNLRQMWEKIAQEMRERGHNFTALQVENKFKTLIRAYRNLAASGKKQNRRKSAVPFQDDLNEIFNSKYLRPDKNETLFMKKDVDEETAGHQLPEIETVVIEAPSSLPTVMSTSSLFNATDSDDFSPFLRMLANEMRKIQSEARLQKLKRQLLNNVFDCQDEEREFGIGSNQ